MEGKTREYYMDECCRLRSKLKSLLSENAKANYMNECYYLRQKIKKLQAKQINKEVLKGQEKANIQKEITQKETIQKLRLENIDLQKRLNNFVPAAEAEKIKLENSTLRESLKTLIIKNKRCFQRDINLLFLRRDNIKMSTATILLTFEYIFMYQKFFEMYVFDYIVDRQNPYNKTDMDTKLLIKSCKLWTDNILQKQVLCKALDVKQFVFSFKSFVTPYLEKDYICQSCEERVEDGGE